MIRKLASMDALKERICFIFWFGPRFGGTEMSEARQRSLATIRISSGLNIQLVTEDNLDDWLLPDSPLTQSFYYLSATHKSDFLRSYFMFHYGGAYSDVKPYTFAWEPYLQRLERSKKAFIGQRQFRLTGLSVRARMPYWLYVCDSYFAFKPGTDFAREWLRRVQELVVSNSEMLRNHPGTYDPRAKRIRQVKISSARYSDTSQYEGYPFGWMDLQGKIFHPLQYERRWDFLRGLPKQVFPGEKYR